MRILLILFVLLPIAEIVVLIKVGGVIGSFSTIGLILFTAFLGAALLRQQGYSAIARAQSKMNQGTIPAQEMVEGIFLAVGGALLLTPGFITDAIGFCCLIPGLRRHLIGWGAKQFSNVKMTTMSGGFQATSGSTFEGGPNRKNDEKNHIIEGECKREE